MKHWRDGSQTRPSLNRHISIPKEVLKLDAETTKQFLALLRNGNIGIPLVILCILAMVILPLPPALLDILFTFNIVLAVMVLLVAVSAKRPLEFSLFPIILLITTLMRLTLNVASTRVVLLHGHMGRRCR
jgi:flagellar biosynthesis protein FlhA